MKKLLSFLPSLTLIFQLMAPAWAYEPAADAEETLPALPVGTRVSAAQYNPLYGEREAALPGRISAPHFFASAAAFNADDFYVDDADVLEAIASGM